MKKDLGIIFGLFALIAVLLIFGQGFTSVSVFNSNQGTPSAAVKTNGLTSITSGSLSVDAEVAAKASDRKKGLAKRDSMPITRGMLFVFDKSDKWAIWMKDMRFAIDIIWIGENKKIVAIANSATPEPGKKDNELTIYKPDVEAKYVLEVNAGLAELNNLKVGEAVNFSLQ